LQSRLAWRLNEAAMNELHKVYLNLGSNIQPEINLVRAIQILSEYGEVRSVSSAWESKSVGAPAPNYLNACVLFLSPLNKTDLKEKIIRPIEARLGRERSENKYIPRTMDIDIILFDDQGHRDSFWNDAFVIIPLAEIFPEYQNPMLRETITETATRLRQEEWMEARPEVLSQFGGSNSRI
jgi:2-amino-4-hydroxy-6-hydroxymethyldihydropteridine diphosphokinase